MAVFLGYIISDKRLLQLISKGGEELNNFYLKLIERKFHVGEADVARKNLNHWEKEDLLPYPYNEPGWTKFSLVEYTWLKVITELRSLGMALDNIKTIKNKLFDVNINGYKPFLIKTLEGFSGEAKNKDDALKAFKNKNIPDKVWKEIFNQAQICDFTILILQILMYNDNGCLIIDSDCNCQFVVFGDVPENKKKINQDILQTLTNQSFVVINIRKILTSFFSNEKLSYDNDYIMGFLNKKEKQIIEKIRSGSVKEVKIRFKNNQPDLFELTQDINTEAEINKIARALKKGQYQDLIIKSRDGKVLSYEKTELIKLK